MRLALCAMLGVAFLAGSAEVVIGNQGLQTTNHPFDC